MLFAGLCLCTLLLAACQDKDSAPEVPLSFNLTFVKSHNPDAMLKEVEVTKQGNGVQVSSPYITKPELVASFETNAKKVLVNGVEQTSGVTVNDFSSPVTYTVVTEQGKEHTYTVSVSYSGLPIVIIDTPNKATIPSKYEDWLEGTKLTILKPDGTKDYEGTIEVRGRGNSTWNFPKKPYALKLGSKAEILGMPKHKRWVLLANWLDRTLLRNRVSFKIASSTGMAWNPRGEFVEVILNGEHVGNYYLCEQIKVDKNRVNISDLEEGDVTGGYILELDVNYDEINKFESQYAKLPYMFKDPDEVNAEQFAYMQNYINDLEFSLYNAEQLEAGEFLEYMDMDSFIDWWFVHELAKNAEPNHPKSTYMYKDKGGKLFAGPAWDFDWGTFRPGTGYTIKGTLYYPKLFKNAAFVARVKERWALLKPEFNKISAFIESEARRIAPSEKMNHVMWPITRVVNEDEGLTFEAAVQRMKAAYEEKVKWLDNAIGGM